jgi:ADP-ribose pyrophosphatase YjhB (NUDIX family)
VNKNQLTRWVTQLQAIAQNGLNYTEDSFDKNRYHELMSICVEMAASHSDHAVEKLHEVFLRDIGHATPKLAVRAVIFNDENKILLVQERSDACWSLPGGWADVNESPSEAVVREAFEESGLRVNTIKLLALYDKQKHDHPPEWPHVYKAFFLCEWLEGTFTANDEISAMGFFDKEELPPLSAPRLTVSQVRRFFAFREHPEWPTDFD